MREVDSPLGDWRNAIILAREKDAFFKHGRMRRQKEAGWLVGLLSLSLSLSFSLSVCVLASLGRRQALPWGQKTKLINNCPPERGGREEGGGLDMPFLSFF